MKTHNPPSTCPSCGGSGSKTVHKGGWEITSEETCSTCGGRGEISNDEEDD